MSGTQILVLPCKTCKQQPVVESFNYSIIVSCENRDCADHGRSAGAQTEHRAARLWNGMQDKDHSW